MPQNLKKFETGSKELDNDLKELFDICESDKLDTVKQAILNKELSEEDFSKVVPVSLIRLSFLLTGPQFNILLEKIHKDSIPFVKKAKSLLEVHFNNLFDSKPAKSLMEDMISQPQDVGEALGDKVVSRITHYFVWEGSPPKLTPAVHLGFKNRKGKLLFDTRVDWDDLSSILEKLSGIFSELLERGKSLAKSRKVDLDYASDVKDRVIRILENFKKIQDVLPTYIVEGKKKQKKKKAKDK